MKNEPKNKNLLSRRRFLKGIAAGGLLLVGGQQAFPAAGGVPAQWAITRFCSRVPPMPLMLH